MRHDSEYIVLESLVGLSTACNCLLTVQLKASTHKSAKTHVGNVLVTRDLDL